MVRHLHPDSQLGPAPADRGARSQSPAGLAQAKDVRSKSLTSFGFAPGAAFIT